MHMITVDVPYLFAKSMPEFFSGGHFSFKAANTKCQRGIPVKMKGSSLSTPDALAWCRSDRSTALFEGSNLDEVNG